MAYSAAMSSDERQHIAANVQMVIDELGELTDFDFGLDRRSVEWVDGFIERQRVRPESTPDVVDRLASVLGSYLGECIAEATDGRWMNMPERGWAVELPNGTIAFPIGKVGKQFDNGPEDSVLGFYDVAVDYVATGGLSRSSD
jgi:hypothetical protein